jgi:hypothetical protein
VGFFSRWQPPRQQAFVGDEFPGRRADAARRTLFQRRVVTQDRYDVTQKDVQNSKGRRHEQVDAGEILILFLRHRRLPFLSSIVHTFLH